MEFMGVLYLYFVALGHSHSPILAHFEGLPRREVIWHQSSQITIIDSATNLELARSGEELNLRAVRATGLDEFGLIYGPFIFSVDSKISNETIGAVCECFDVELPVSSIFRSLSRLLTSGKVVARPFLDVQPACPDPDLFQLGSSKDDFAEWELRESARLLSMRQPNSKAVVRFPINFFFDDGGEASSDHIACRRSPTDRSTCSASCHGSSASLFQSLQKAILELPYSDLENMQENFVY